MNGPVDLHDTSVHPSAIVHSDAVLHPGVELGPYSVVGPGVELGVDVRVGAHAVIERDSRLRSSGPEVHWRSHAAGNRRAHTDQGVLYRQPWDGRDRDYAGGVGLSAHGIHPCRARLHRRRSRDSLERSADRRTCSGGGLGDSRSPRGSTPVYPCRRAFVRRGCDEDRAGRAAVCAGGRKSLSGASHQYGWTPATRVFPGVDSRTPLNELELQEDLAVEVRNLMNFIRESERGVVS